MKRDNGRSAITVVAALFCCASLVFAGSLAGGPADNAKIEGTVQDTSGAAIPQATVTLKPPSGADKRVTTDAKGAFNFASLASGTYSLTMEAPGFQKTRYTNIALTDAQTRQFDFTLTSGAVSEAVEVDVTRPTTLPKNLASDPRFGPAVPLAPSGSGGTVSGRILNASGSSASGITVGVIAVGTTTISSFLPQQLTFSSRADSLGFYRLENLPQGRYFIVAGNESFTQNNTVIDRPIFFPGVTDSSRALTVTVSPGREEIADFRLDSPSLFSPQLLTRPTSSLRLGGQLVNLSFVALPLLGGNQWGIGQQIAWGQLRVTLQPSVIAVIGVDGLGAFQNIQGGCRPPAQAAFASAVTSDGRFDFIVPAGIYDLCVFGNRIAPGAGGGSRGGGAWAAVTGPFTVVVDRDIDSVLVDLSRR